MTNLKYIQHAQFVENVLGIKLSLAESCLLMEGKTPSALVERIKYETQLYEGFLDGIAKAIGDIPSNIQKTLINATDVLKFIYNVVADKTGENLKKAIAILTRNIKALMTKIGKIITSLPTNIQEVCNEALQWLKTKMSKFIDVKSDVDDADDLKGDSGNWKKFISLLLGGCIVVMLYKAGDIVKDFGADALQKGIESILSMTNNTLAKIIAEPQVALQAAGGKVIATTMIPLFKIYAGAKILEVIKDELLDENAWLKKA